MRKHLIDLLTIFLIISKVSIAQNSRYIFIQSNKNQPFYVMLNGKNHSSTINGFCTISGLQPLLYDIKIGFPKSSRDEIEFSVDVSAEDKGFLFFDEASPVLQDIQNSNRSTAKDNSQIISKSSTVTIPVIVSQSILPNESLQIKYKIDSLSESDTITIQIAPNSKIINNANNTCLIASQDDFLNVRLQMAAANNEEDLLQIAEKQNKRFCFSVEQVKLLSALCITEVTKYNFLLKVYPAIYDKKNIAQLISLFQSHQLIQNLKKQWNLL